MAKLSPEEKQRRAEERRQKRWNETHKIIDGVDHKLCGDCKEYYPATDEYFYAKEKNKTDGLDTYCKECTKKNAAEWINNNYDRYLEIKRKQNTNEVSRAIHREMSRKRVRDGRRKEWESKNRDKLTTYYVYRKMNKDHEISEEEWLRCLEFFNHTCAYCGMTEEEHQETNNQVLHKDHFNHDGANDLSNAVPCCRSCNSSKSDSKFEEWIIDKNIEIDDGKINKIKQWLDIEYKLYIKPPKTKRKYTKKHEKWFK